MIHDFIMSTVLMWNFPWL